MDIERQPNHTDDPRRQSIGSGGYPETNPKDATADARSGKPNTDDGDHNAPSPSTDKEADREHSTGNPNAAG